MGWTRRLTPLVTVSLQAGPQFSSRGGVDAYANASLLYEYKVADRVINVYVPTSPNPTSGYLLFVPESELIPVNMSVDEAMKMMFSGGMYTPRAAEPVGAGTGKKR